ncbi:MAG: alpha/beta fold hydrolase [Terriglobales bacterium]
MISTAEASTDAVGGQSDDRYLDLDGARVRYRDEGRGAAVLLVHGWTLDLDVWASQVEALRGAFRIIRFDRRGFGRSTGEPSMEQDILDLGGIIEHFKLARVALVGMSQGSRAVLAYACAHPTQVSCIVLDGPPEFDGSIAGANLSLAPLRDLVRTRGLAAFRQQWLQHPLMQLRSRDVGARELLERIVDRYPGRDLAEGTAHAPPPDLWPQLESLAVPTLVLTGEHDLPGRLRSADELAKRLPAGRRAVIAGSGHLASFDNPDSYNRQLAAFLAAHADGAS